MWILYVLTFEPLQATVCTHSVGFSLSVMSLSVGKGVCDSDRVCEEDLV